MTEMGRHSHFLLPRHSRGSGNPAFLGLSQGRTKEERIDHPPVKPEDDEKGMKGMGTPKRPPYLLLGLPSPKGEFMHYIHNLVPVSFHMFKEVSSFVLSIFKEVPSPFWGA